MTFCLVVHAAEGHLEAPAAPIYGGTGSAQLRVGQDTRVDSMSLAERAPSREQQAGRLLSRCPSQAIPITQHSGIALSVGGSAIGRSHAFLFQEVLDIEA